MERQLSKRLNEDGQPEPVVDVRLRVKAGDTWTVHGIFDVHADSTDCHIPMLKRDISTIAADPKARVVVGGDFNDMIFHGDPRYTPAGLKPFLWGTNDVVNAVVEYNISLLEPIKDKIDVYISGNHEEVFLKRHHSNVAAMTAKALGVPYCSYFALLRYFCTDANKQVRKTRGWIHHGHGGNAPVTKGMIPLARAMEQGRFDWIMLGHLHQKTYSEVVTLDEIGPFGQGRLLQHSIAGLQCGSYKRNYAGGESASWSAMKGHRPSALGAGRLYLDIASGHEGGMVVTPRVN